MSTNLYTRILYLGERGILPPRMYVRYDGVIITASILKEMERYSVRPIDGLAGLAARLGFEYEVYKMRQRSVKCMLIHMKMVIHEADSIDDLKDEIKQEVLALIRKRKLTPAPGFVRDYIAKCWGPHKSLPRSSRTRCCRG